jgi:hypothetical protein
VVGFLKAVIVAMRAPLSHTPQNLTLMDFLPHQSKMSVAWQVPVREE